ncbi:MAG: ATP-binding cassette domain-containing protein [Mycoplasmataceae bacterium]|nr:ATP-binding cassette domain-containing protein [Mycoplasmataceae bacterium]
MLFFLGMTLGHEFYFPGAVAVSVLTIGLVFMPQSIFEFKNSTLLKRIGTTPISPIKFLIVIIIFNFIIMIVSIILVIISSFIVFYSNLHSSKMDLSLVGTPFSGASWLQMLDGVDWASFIYSTFLLIFLTMIVGILLASIARSTLFIQGVGITILMITFFVGPAVLPIGMTTQVDAIKYSSYLLPFKYPISLMTESFNGFKPQGDLKYIMNLQNSNIWDINNEYVLYNVFSSISGKEPSPLVIFKNYDKILNHIMPFFFMGIFGFFAIGKFSWSTRSSNKMNWRIFSSLINFTKNKKDGKHNGAHAVNLNSEYLIEAHNITKTFIINGTKFNANNDISINFKAGEPVAILGSNGAGKTTFVEMMVGLNKPSSGYFQYNYKSKINFQESLGIQFQDSSYPAGLKCKDIILFLKDAYQIDLDNDELNKLIEEFGVDKFYNKSAHSLSGGQQQRLNLLLAIMHKPKLVFLDELSTGLDIKIRTTIKKFIKKFAEENNMTIILISHDMAEVDYLTKRIIVLQNGEVVVDRKKSEIEAEHKDLETFLEPYL